uniref:Uncharacterized protein n=1 Tax=Acanthochromis polyacanthus TaxID=80966 RepID=A0A3Q1FN13_9TELE
EFEASRPPGCSLAGTHRTSSEDTMFVVTQYHLARRRTLQVVVSALLTEREPAMVRQLCHTHRQKSILDQKLESSKNFQERIFKQPSESDVNNIYYIQRPEEQT